MKNRALPYILLFLYLIVVWAGCWILLSDSAFWTAGLVLTACGVTVLAVYIMVSRLAPASKGENAAQPTPTALPPEAALSPNEIPPEIRTLIAEGQQKLSASPTLASQRAKTPLTSLPLYLIIGPENGGKTSALMEAGLEPELLAGQTSRDSTIASTRLCNLWFVRNSLVADVSGRVVSQGGPLWRGLLTALRHRKGGRFSKWFSKLSAGQSGSQSNLRGVVVCCEASDFSGVPDSSRLNALAKQFQERLQQIGETYRADFPAYVIFTKSDAIKYFREFFSRVTPEEATQPLGCLLGAHPKGVSRAAYAEAETQRVTHAFNQLFYSLADWRVKLLAREEDLSKKPAIYEFPREMKRVRSAVTQFLVDAFRPNSLQPGAVLKGFYFAGTRQITLSSNDRTISITEPTRMLSMGQVEEAMRRGAGASRPAVAVAPYAVSPQDDTEHTASGWLFTPRLFTGILSPNQQPVAVYADRGAERFRTILLCAASAIALLLFGFIARSWWNNRELVESVSEAAAALGDSPRNFRAPRAADLTQLDHLRDSLDQLDTYSHTVPWGMGFFLYSGDKLVKPARQLYFTRFRERLLNDAMAVANGTLKELPAQPDATHPYQNAYDQLKGALMVTGGACKVERPFLPDLLTANWQNSPGGDPGAAKLARRNFDYYAGELAGNRAPVAEELNKPLVEKARAYLNGFGGEQRIYRTMLDAVAQSLGPAQGLATYSHRYAEAIAVGPEPGSAFTPKGWSLFQERLRKMNGGDTGDSCVLGDGTRASASFSGASLEPAIRNLYVRDYTRNWRNYVASAHVLPFQSVKDAATKLGVMEEGSGPLLGVLFFVHTNTSLPNEAEGGSIREAAKPAISSMADRIAAPFGKAGKVLRDKAMTQAAKLSPEAGQPAQALGANDINAAFQPVHSLFGPGTNAGNWIDKTTNLPYMNALGDMHKAMENLAQAGSPETDVPLNAAAETARQNGIGLVRTLSYGFMHTPEGVSDQATRLLKEPFDHSQPYIVPDMAKGKVKKMNEALQSFCPGLSPLLKRFPFNPQGPDAGLEDAKAVFGPDGRFALFYRQTLASVLVRAPGRFSIGPTAPPDLKLEPGFLDWMNRMAAVSDALYPETGAKYKLSVLQNSLVRDVTLNIDGETALPGTPKQFSWPSAGPGLNLDVKLPGDVSQSMASYNGPWSVYHLAAEADARNAGEREITISRNRHGQGNEGVIKVGGVPVAIKILVVEPPGGISTAFDRTFFTGLKCPARVATP